MSRVTKLRRLERAVRRPQAKPARARALANLRSEASPEADWSPPAAPRLPVLAGLEEQIAVVRGRSPGTPSRGLLELEERLLGSPPASEVQPTIFRYEHLPGMRRVVSNVDREQTHAQALVLAEARYLERDVFDTTPIIEPFEAPLPEEPDPMRARHPTGRADTSDPEDVPPLVVAKPRARSDTGDQARGVAPHRTLRAEDRALVAGFARDVDAVLGSDSLEPVAESAQRVAPEDLSWEQAVAGKGQPPGPATAAGQEEAPPPPTRTSHAVFDQMGLAMNYANSFDLGAIDLSARLDQFDRELAVEPTPEVTKPISVPMQALALDDFDLVADLAEITKTQAKAQPPSSLPEDLQAPAGTSPASTQTEARAASPQEGTPS